MEDWDLGTWLTVLLTLLALGYILMRAIQNAVFGVPQQRAPKSSTVGRAAGPAKPVNRYETIVLDPDPVTPVYPVYNAQPIAPPVLVFRALYQVACAIVQGIVSLCLSLYRSGNAQTQYASNVQSYPLPYDRRRDAAGRYADEDDRELAPLHGIAHAMPQGLSQTAQEPIVQAIVLGKNPIENVALALAVMPRNCPPIIAQAQRNQIPIFYDANTGQWEVIELGGKDTGYVGVFGLSGGGKGNVIRYMSLHACAVGADRMVYAAFDSKSGVDYAWVDDIPHAEAYWLGDITDEEDRAHNLLLGLDAFERIMHRRDKALRKARVANIHEYNAAVRSGALPGAEVWPIIVCVVDEVADMPDKAKAIVDTLTRMARAAGFVMIIATQYPTTDALSSQAANNLKNRLIFQTANSRVSHVYLAKTKEEGWLYEPTAINRVGVAIWRRIGESERLGLVPNVNDHQARLIAEAVRAGTLWQGGALAITLLQQAENSAKIADRIRAGADQQLAQPGATHPAKEDQQLDSDQEWRLVVQRYPKLITDEAVQRAVQEAKRRIANRESELGIKALARYLYQNDSSDYFYAAQAINKRVNYLLSSGAVVSSA